MGLRPMALAYPNPWSGCDGNNNVCTNSPNVVEINVPYFKSQCRYDP